MISYNLAPIPVWPLRDNQGNPLSNGYMLAYRDLVRSDLKPVYMDPAGLNAYVQPIVFNAAGFQGPFYFASDENYYLEIYDSNSNLVKTIGAYNAPFSGGSGPITIISANRNYIQDSQFRFILKDYSPVPTDVLLGVSNWFFQKTNNTAIDSITVNDFILGSTTPPFNPPSYIRYTCSVAGTGETFKHFFFRFQSVFTFQNTEVTFAFWAKAQTAGTIVRVLVFQVFGEIGVSPPVINYPVDFNLTTEWAQYSITFTVPSVAGKTIDGSALDALGIGIDFPLDSICQIDVTNFQLNSGNILQPFDYLTPNYEVPLQIPFFVAGENNKLLSLDPMGFMGWNSAVNVGYYFTGNSPLVSLGDMDNVLPIVPGTNPNNWISGNRFTPTQPCFAWITAFYNVGSASGDVEIQLTITFNGLVVSSESISIGDPGATGQLTLVANIPFNGTGDFMEILGRFSGSGVAGAELFFLAIKTL